MQKLKADAVVCGYIYRVIREYPGITRKEMEDTFGYSPKLVQDAIDGLVLSGVIVNSDGHFTAATIRKRG